MTNVLKYSLIMLLPFLLGCFNSTRLKLLWYAPIASGTTPIVQNGTVYVSGFHSGHPEEPQRLFAFDALNGTQRWISQDSVELVYGESGGYVFFRNGAKHLVQLDAITGEKIHESAETDTPILHWVIKGDTMFIVNSSKEVVAVDNRQSKVLWRLALPLNAGIVTSLQLSAQNLIVSGNRIEGEDHYGVIWALNLETGKEIWHFEAPKPHDYAPLDVLVYDKYVLATNTAPLVLLTYVLDVNSGKELYAPVSAFDFHGCHADKAYAPSGTFDLKTGHRIDGTVDWISASVIFEGIAWKPKITSIGMKAVFLRDTYDGDYRGHRDWLNTPPNSALEGFDIATGKSVSHTKEYKFTRFTLPVAVGGVLYHTSIALMREGKSGVWAYKMPANH